MSIASDVEKARKKLRDSMTPEELEAYDQKERIKDFERNVKHHYSKQDLEKRIEFAASILEIQPECLTKFVEQEHQRAKEEEMVKAMADYRSDYSDSWYEPGPYPAEDGLIHDYRIYPSDE